MKHLLTFFALMSAITHAQSLPPPSAGSRVVVEISSDLQTWTQGMPYNSPRGFIRARTETNAQFAAWITAADALTGSDVEIFVNGQRNPQCWGSSIDLTPFCTSAQAGVLVSPCHVLFVTHWHPAVGDTLQWLTADNQTVSRTLTALVSLTDTAGLFPDITVGKLGEAAPPSIGFVRVMSDTTREWQGFQVPVCYRNQFNRLIQADINLVALYGSTQPRYWLEEPLNATRKTRYTPIISGDSGSPVCVVQDGALVLLGLISTASGGTFLPACISDVNAVMTSLGGGYQLTRSE